MNCVLVVDDEESIRLSIRRAMRLLAPELKLLTAPNGAAAVALLELQNVDLLVTDLLMPQMDGFELLAWLSQNQPMTPAIVMTALRNDAMQARVAGLGAGLLLHKPFDANAFVGQVREVLGAAARGVIKGIGLGTFVQMVGLEKKTCTLRVTADGRRGSLAFMEGELIGAETDRGRGQDAALDVLSWDRSAIEVVPSCREQVREIDLPLEYLLMESYRLKDERPSPSTKPPEPSLVGSMGPGPERMIPALSLEGQLTCLREIDGYRGAAILDDAGTPLATDAADPVLDLFAVCASAGEILRGVRRSGRSAQVDGCQELVLRSSEALLLLRSGPGAPPRFHVLVSLKALGNRALAMVRLDALVPVVAAWIE